MGRFTEITVLTTQSWDECVETEMIEIRMWEGFFDIFASLEHKSGDGLKRRQAKYLRKVECGNDGLDKR